MTMIKNAAKSAQILPFIESCDKKFNTLVGERGLKLSGGEKQRVAIARALMKSCPIILFDEATSSLDTKTEKDLQGAITDATENSTTLIIAHRLSTVKDCDWIVVLSHGKIVEEGTHQQLINRDGEYRRLWDKQAEEVRVEKMDHVENQEEEKE